MKSTVKHLEKPTKPFLILPIIIESARMLILDRIHRFSWWSCSLLIVRWLLTIRRRSPISFRHVCLWYMICDLTEPHTLQIHYLTSHRVRLQLFILSHVGSVVVWPLSCALQSAGISDEGKHCRKIKSLTPAFDRSQITTLNCPRYADHTISHEPTFIICHIKSLIWVQDDLKLPDDDGWIDTPISTKRLVVRVRTMKSPLSA
jgi:hypothetical protein